MDSSPVVTRNFMAMAFLAANMAYALGFSIFYWSESVQRSTLYQALDRTFGWLPQIWGLALLLGTGLCIWDAYAKMKRRHCRRIGTALGLVLWGYGAFVFLFTGFYLVFFSVGLLYCSFWFWYYFKFVKKYTGDDWDHLVPPFHL